MLCLKKIFMAALLLSAVGQTSQASDDDYRDHHRRHGKSSHRVVDRHQSTFSALEKELDRLDRGHGKGRGSFDDRRHDRRSPSPERTHCDQDFNTKVDCGSRCDVASVVIPQLPVCEELDFLNACDIGKAIHGLPVKPPHVKHHLVQHCYSDQGIVGKSAALAASVVKFIPGGWLACAIAQWGLDKASCQLSRVTGRNPHC